jgi:Tol biopolymer transport system component
MALTPGTKLGPYEIQSSLGAGGMGEVYRAKDTRLDRTVAIKILPVRLSDRPEACERFEREARAISSLNHPNICHLYDVGQQDGVRYLVMEFLEGETLADRLRRGPLPLKQVLRYGAEIAEGLETAHRSGVIHRDLKPSNIALTKTGAKLMDFGLAKEVKPANAPSSGLTETIAGLAQPLTAEGMIVGTFQYMSPEQIEGKEATARSDIFALGAVLYEMATGKQAFEGKTQASIVAAILASEPQSISATQPMTPPSLGRVVKKCLAKDPEDRWQSASDLASELTWIAEGGPSASLPAAELAGGRRNLPGWAIAALGTLAVLVFAVLYFLHSGGASYPIRASIPAPENTSFEFLGDAAGPLVLSADGRILAFVAAHMSGAPEIYVRPLDSLEARALPGTENAWAPFWSPNSQMIGFFADGKLKTIDLQGGGPVSVCDAPNGRGGSWAKDGNIIFTPDFRSPIYRVPASGGTPVPVTKVDESKHTSHRWPFLLPDGKHFLYLAVNHQAPQDQNDAIYYASLDGKENRLITPAFTNAEYASGFLLYLRNAQLEAQRFEPESGELKGELQQVATGVTGDESTWRGIFTVSANGILAYSGSAQAQSQLAWFDRSGKQLGTIGEKFSTLDRRGELRLSPNGDRVAFSIQGNVTDVWIMDLARGVRSRMTFGPVGNSNPVWSPDGKWIAYDALTRQGDVINRRPAEGGAEEQLLPEGKSPSVAPRDWSRDGKYLLYESGAVGARQEIWALPLFGDRKQFQVVPSGAFYNNYPQLSRDGRWLVYQSNESGRAEVYVVPFRAGPGKWRVSTSGGTLPHWRGDGKEIFYLSLDGVLTAVPVIANTNRLQLGATEPLFRVPANTYDVSPDGHKFLLNVVGDQNTKPITLVVNWAAELKK